VSTKLNKKDLKGYIGQYIVSDKSSALTERLSWSCSVLLIIEF